MSGNLNAKPKQADGSETAMRLTTLTLIASLALPACGGGNELKNPEPPPPNRWVAMTPDATDPISGAHISRDGNPLYALDMEETRRIYEWARAHTGMVSVEPPHVIYTSNTIYCDGRRSQGCAWDSKPTAIAVQANSNTPDAVRAITCHEIVHHLFYEAGYGSESRYNKEHAAPYYFACELKYRNGV